MCTRNKHREAGVTLIELVLFIVIISVAVGGILGVMSLVTRNSADPVRHKQALMLAEAFLEEVELAGFTYCEPNTDNADTAKSVADCAAGMAEGFGPETGDSRPYDNVNDYANAPGNMPFNDPATNELLDSTGRSLSSDLPGYAVTVTMKNEDLNGIQGVAKGDLLHITVKVAYDNGQQVQLDGYRARYAPQAQ